MCEPKNTFIDVDLFTECSFKLMDKEHVRFVLVVLCVHNLLTVCGLCNACHSVSVALLVIFFSFLLSDYYVEFIFLNEFRFARVYEIFQNVQPKSKCLVI